MKKEKTLKMLKTNPDRQCPAVAVQAVVMCLISVKKRVSILMDTME